jgi:hypothetical protein
VRGLRKQCQKPQLLKRLGWPSIIGEGGILALGVTGIQVNPNDDTARLLKSAMRQGPKSSSMSVAFLDSRAISTRPCSLGIKPKYEKSFLPKTSSSTLDEFSKKIALRVFARAYLTSPEATTWTITHTHNATGCSRPTRRNDVWAAFC